MNTQTSTLDQQSIVPLQTPKDVSVGEIEAELGKIWQFHGETSVARAATFNLLVYEPEEAAGIPSASVEAIATQNPCRVIDLCPSPDGKDEGLTAQVAAYCPVQKRRSTLVCCEYITIQGNLEAHERLHSTVEPLLITGLPVFLWWKASPVSDSGLFDRLVSLSNRVIIDSAFFSSPEADLLQVQRLSSKGVHMSDLNWSRLAPWQELTAQAFDPPERRASLQAVDRVTVDFEKGNSTQALLYLGWLASRLQWRPLSYSIGTDDYELRHITFVGPNGQTVEAELAAVPVGNVGSVVGDLIGLRLTSTDDEADCCTVLCSESTGCMRMEASGGAQSCRIQQVTSLADQDADALLGQQLQRWSVDALYTDSLTIAAAIVESANAPVQA
ncbi:glucose-6-phosphate dehydrogenase assembly protein OpcA [Leptolyngbya sp. FACHB-261]|uniref:glucose-6-phosphate dehydrogenase assembly protein OpcA n=1 Tax=Leptolyngbya sp. FACHB-261 TaxID=2692806 RepID=UPI0016895FBE|nr:glucose-6-phosphate dehydrogenase assembly protein OpcA [Leptolyngbya sp. FACHB-261]MBD2103568.1 glucose-6-phosphate dehydrogenase assembly protein OpcA [Leptolyngbya sp. FACHB-261]